MISQKHSALAMLLAVYRCFSSAPLSLVQRHLESIYYFGTSASPKIIPRHSSQTSKIQFNIVNRYRSISFTAVVKETINCLNWFMDNLERNIPGNPDNYLGFFWNRTLSLSIANSSRTYEMCNKRDFLTTI